MPLKICFTMQMSHFTMKLNITAEKNGEYYYKYANMILENNMEKDSNNIWLGLQIDTTKLDPNNLNREIELKEKVSLAKEIINPSALLIWAHSDPKSIEIICEYCSGTGIEKYLWYPVLADIPNFTIPDGSKVANFNGRRGFGDIGRWDKLGTYASGREKFEFVCPNNKEALTQIFDIYKGQLNNQGFDGVFLDRIRFPSAAMGFEMLFSCFCENCREQFRKEFDSDLNRLQAVVKELFKKQNTFNCDFLKNAQTLQELVFPDTAKNFIRFKNQSIFKVVDEFSKYAKKKGKKVGLDLFSYSLAGTVSQDYELLGQTCDWIKPMIYCHSRGPAGFPLELHSLLYSLLKLNPELRPEELINSFSRILDISLPAGLEDIMVRGIPENMISVEMENISALNIPSTVGIYPGFEAMKMDDICIITEEILEAYLHNTIDQKAKGFILTWNLLEMPPENLSFTARYLSRLQG